MEVNGLKVKYGEFMMYSMGVENLNPDNYPDLLAWDFVWWADSSKIGRKGTFLGWGIGLHPCHGMRMAKHDLKITTAVFLHMFEHSRVDKHGNPFPSVPEPNLSDPRLISPKGEGRLLQYRRRPGNVAKQIF